MSNTHTHEHTHVGSNDLIIAYLLDRSGSMQSVKDDVIGGFNRFLEEQRQVEGTCRLVFTMFDSQGIDTEDYPRISGVPQMTSSSFVPRGMTPLYDAIGETIARVDKVWRSHSDRVLFVIHTDGIENASREYTQTDVRSLINERQASGWEFLYLGVGLDAFVAGTSIGVPAGQTVSVSPANTDAMYAATSASVSSVRSGAAVADVVQSTYVPVAERDSRPSTKGNATKGKTSKAIGEDE